MKIVIIGSGKTGRGFLARLCIECKYTVVFVDSNIKLIESLNSRGKYNISFFNGEKESVEISGYTAFHNTSYGALTSISEADIVFTSVSSNNATNIAPLLRRAIAMGYRKEPLRIIAAENGTGMVSTLLEHFGPQEINICQAVVFCTTVEQEDDYLSIVSENYNELYYDAEKAGIFLNCKVFVHRSDILNLMKLKLYTYNCINAIISFNGYFKGYKLLADAANDKNISFMVSTHCEAMDEVLSIEYNVPLDEQKTFSKKAILKFSNPEIIDPITRNIRNAQSKLTRDERLIAPLLLLKNHNKSYQILVKTVAAAIKYGLDECSLSVGENDAITVEAVLNHICGITDKNLINEIISQS
jgi:mannitol-1-phosphate 5-dehydrogenase